MHYYSLGKLPRQLARHLTPALAGLGLLLAPTGAAWAQTTPAFSSPVLYNTSGAAQGIVSADFNGDGRPDLATANSSQNSVAVLLQSATTPGTFPAISTYGSGGSFSPVLATGDLNGDGRPDLAVANQESNTVGVLLNSATTPGSFGSVVVYTASTASRCRGIAIADVNGDGANDLITGTNSQIGVRLGSKTTPGTFGALTTYASGSSVTDEIVVGDVNGDGRPDIVAGNTSTNTVSVLLNSATTPGTFGAAVTYLTNANSSLRGVALGDLNNDNRPDIVAVNDADNTVSVLLNSATTPGTFPTAVSYALGSSSPLGVTIGDLNGDGFAEIVAENYGGNYGVTVSVLVNSPTTPGSFPTAANVINTGGMGPCHAVIRDLNADGKPDLAIANFYSNDLSVLLSTTSFTAPTLSSVNPTSGPVGTSVTLTGARLGGATAVSFNGTAASTFAVVNATTVTATVPTGATTGNVTVTTSGGTSNGVAFAVNPTVAISSTAGSSGSTTTTSPLPFTVTFSQGVTGFVVGDVTVTNGMVSSLSGSGTTYALSITPTTPGTPTTVSVAANVAQTSAGTGNVASATYSLQYNALVTATTWTGNSSTDWFAAGNWTAGVPTSTLDAFINSGAARYPVLTSGTASAKNLVLGTNASLTQSGGAIVVSGDGFAIDGTFTATGGVVSLAGSSEQRLGGTRTAFYDLTVGTAGARLDGPVDIQQVLTLNGTLSTIARPLTLLSTSAGTAMVVNNNGATVAGTATVQRYIDPSLNPGLGYRHYSSPVQSATVGTLATGGFSPVVNPDYNTLGNTVNPFPTVYGYDQSRITGASATTQTFEYGYYSPQSRNDVLTPGLGYTVHISASEKVEFSGTLNNGIIAMPLANNRASATNSGWHLVGNPYPAPLNYSLVDPADRAGLESAIFVFSSTSQYGGQYRVFINGVGGNSVIPSGQGFFVRVAAGQSSGSLTFRNSQRLTGGNSTTFQRPAAEARPLVQLDLQGAGTSDPVYVYFENGATAGFDSEFDAEKLPNTNGLNLSSIAAGTTMAVNGLPGLSAATVVPLSVGVPTTGTYTLQAAALLNLSTTDVYLHDAVTGQYVNLKQQSSYSFTASNAALITDRFSLSFAPLRPLAAQNGFTAASVSVYPNPAHKSFTVAVPAVSGTTQAKLTLYSVLGQAVRTTTLALPASGTQATIDVQNLPTGVYVLRVQAGPATITKQVVVD
ncbi:putative secreted protein (Por secretion system target) [Hymenobacter chitinivorans DSM 11115]|uniref:Putative secreted protein (Por secretion system target) n=2 Tax=Hymenobacter chitinivorans TaxID=89969 RepID=A0A2M9BM60_9BACT|nr:putative secreted protein (Por secretion system target) [Hymenobacter chitinivorans DSM 11115]